MVVLANSNLKSQFLGGIIILLAFGIVPSVLTLYLLKKYKKISDWDISIRKERPLTFSILFCIALIVMFIYQKFSYTNITNLNILLIVQFLLLFAITLFWKISGHTSTVTIACLVISNIWLPFYWFSGFIIPVIVWSRVYRKNHTISQAIVGVLLSLVVFQLGLFFKLV